MIYQPEQQKNNSGKLLALLGYMQKAGVFEKTGLPEAPTVGGLPLGTPQGPDAGTGEGEVTSNILGSNSAPKASSL